MVLSLRNVYKACIQHAFLIIGIVIGIFGVITLYVRVKVIFLCNPDIGGIENNVIYSILRMLAGYPLYQDPTQAPYAITQYSPLYYYLVVGLLKLIGFSPEDVYEVYAIGRIVSLIANIGYAYGIVLIARELGLPKWWAFGVGILAFSLLPPQSYARPDSLYNAFVMWTFWAMLRWREGESAQVFNYNVILTALFVALAFFSKQSAMCLPVIIGVYALFLGKQTKQLVLFGSCLLIFLALLYVGFVREDFSIFYANVVQGINNGIDLNNFRHNLIDHYLRPFVWLVVPSLAISIRYIVFEQGERQFLGLANIGLFLFAMATGLKWGSALNYFTEFTGVSCLLVADVVWKLRQTKPVGTELVYFSLMLFVIGAVPVNAMNFNWERTLGKPIDLTQYRQEQAITDFLKKELQNSPTCYVYSTTYNSSYFNALLFRNCIVPQQDLIIASAYPNRTFDYSDLEKATQDGRIRYIISRADENEAPLSPPIYFANYSPIKSFGNYRVYTIQPIKKPDDLAVTSPFRE